MFKLLIVEDEHIVRLALRSLIDWTGNGIEIVAESVNGLEAVEVLKMEDIDLVITDINMPVMNGLELIQTIDQMGLNPSIIVLSAYNDYHYVRDAFKLGVKDYILKSEMDPNHVLELVKRTLSTRVKHALTAGNKHMDPSADKDNYLILKSMASGVDSIEKITVENVYKALGFKGDYDCCVVLVDEFAKTQARYGKKDLGTFSKHVTESINYQLAKERLAKVVCIEANVYMVLYCGLGASEAANRHKLELVLRNIQKSLEVYLDITVSIGVVNHCHSLFKLNDYYKEAVELANLRYIYGKGRIIYQKTAHLIKQIDSERILGQEVALIDAIKALDPNGVDLELDHLLNRIASFKSESEKQLTGFYLELVLVIILKCSEIDPEIQCIFDQNENFYEKIKHFETKEEVHGWIKAFVRNILVFFSKKNQHNESNQIKKAKKYIMKHYMENIGLSCVAEEVELSECYLSKLFVMETGETFIHFLTRYRIDKACEMLRSSNLKIYEVAKNIGYENVEHFSRVFKKAMGLSPIEYKKHS